MTQYNAPTTGAAQAFSIASIASIIAAIASFYFGAGLGFLLAVAAIVLGAIGALAAISPRTRGGMISVMAVLLGLVGIIAAVFKLFAR